MFGLGNISCENGKKTGLMALYVLYTVKKKPKSGYEILSDIKLKCNDSWAPSKGTLYPLLTKLESENLIAVKEVGVRSKNIFEITPKGKKLLISMQKERENFRERFSLFRNLFSEFMGSDKTEMLDLIFNIRELSYRSDRKDDVKKILERCLSELKEIE